MCLNDTGNEGGIVLALRLMMMPYSHMGSPTPAAPQIVTLSGPPPTHPPTPDNVRYAKY